MDETPIKPITLVLADDHGMVREGIAAFCQSRPNFRVLAQCSDGVDAVGANPDPAAGFRTAGSQYAQDVGYGCRAATAPGPLPCKVLILSVNRDENIIRELFRSGANGYLLKDGPARHLFDAIYYVQDGGQYLTPLIRRESIENTSSKADPITLLSKREFEVFSLLVDGHRPKDIAKLLEISPKTVDTYRANIMRKLELDSVAGLVKFAIQRNLQVSSIPC